jgi:hypothetical protein
VDVVSESRKAGQQQRFHAPQKAGAASGGRSVDAGAPNRRRVREEKELKSSNFVKPSNGLEPLTPSLPCKRSQPAATVFAFSCGFVPTRFATSCDRLQPRGSIKAPSFVANAGDARPRAGRDSDRSPVRGRGREGRRDARVELARLGDCAARELGPADPAGKPSNPSCLNRSAEPLRKSALSSTIRHLTDPRRIDHSACGAASPLPANFRHGELSV